MLYEKDTQGTYVTYRRRGIYKLLTTFKDDGISSGLILAIADNNWCGFQHLYITSDEEIKEGDW